jgi:hypothetical protein
MVSAVAIRFSLGYRAATAGWGPTTSSLLGGDGWAPHALMVLQTKGGKRAQSTDQLQEAIF